MGITLTVKDRLRAFINSLSVLSTFRLKFEAHFSHNYFSNETVSQHSIQQTGIVLLAAAFLKAFICIR
jgi:hypothetical protein